MFHKSSLMREVMRQTIITEKTHTHTHTHTHNTTHTQHKTCHATLCKAYNELISLSHDLTAGCAVLSCRFKADFPPLSNSREQEEGNESRDRGGPDVFKHDTAAAQ